MPLTPGTRLGPYEVLSALGAGGMGDVYRARDTRLDRTVAVKVISDALAGSPELRERFDREARAIGALNHPHICTLHDVGHENGVDFLVLEYLEGESLADRLARGAGSPLRIDEVLKYAMEIASALDKAHGAGIVHRDLKPANVFLTKAGSKLLDFGLAKTGRAAAPAAASMLPTTPPALTQTGTVLGTFQYMAPEQLEGRDADARSDIFAFGAVVYEMATGRKAFESTSQASLIAAIMDRDPAPLSSLQPVAPAALDWVVAKCLAKDPEERWQSARDLLAQLKFIAAGSATTVGAPAVAAAARRRAAPPWMWAALVVLALVATVAGSVGVRHLLERPVSPERTQFTVTVADKAVLYDAPVLSPDGTRIMIAAADEAGLRQIWVRPLDGLAFQRLAGTEGASYPFWSGDGREIGFFADGKLKKLDANGGSPVTLCDAAGGRGATWNRDGVIVFATNGARSLQTVSALGGAPRALGQGGARDSTVQGNARFPHFLPDGRHFLYFRLTRDAATEGVYLASLDAPDGTRVATETTEADFARGRLFFVRNGTLMSQALDVDRGRTVGDAIPVASQLLAGANEAAQAFSVSENGTVAYRGGLKSLGLQTQLTWVDRSGRTIATLGPPGAWFNPELSPDGQRVAAARALGTSGFRDMWMLDVARGTAVPLTSDPGDEAFPVWTSDGRQIVYCATRTDWCGDIDRKAANGAGGVETVFRDGRIKLPAAMLGDGSVLFVAVQTGQWRLEATSGTTEPHAALKIVPGLLTTPSVSADGRWITYSAVGDSGRPEVFVDAFPMLGTKRQVSATGGSSPRWRRDGREIFYLAPDRRMMAVRVGIAGGEIEPDPPVPLFDAPVAGGSVPDGGANTIAFRREYDVTADGQRFLLNVVTASSMSITVATNWTSKLAGAR